MRTIASRRQSVSSGRFVGRIAEQQLFRATLRQLAALRALADEQLGDDDLSYAQIFLVAAEGGMGKSTLLRRFAELVAENADSAGARAIVLDLERHGAVADADTFLRLLHDALAAAGFEHELEPYRQSLARRTEARRKAADAEEQLRSRALGLGERWRQPTQHEQRAFIEQRLDAEELRLVDDLEATSDDFMQALNRSAAPARPLVLLVDTYELADRCDRWLRQRLLPLTGPRLVWVIAGREGQPFIRRYEDEFGAGLARGILLDTFARPDIVAYVRQCGVAAPGDVLIEQLQALSRGVPLALEGWFNLYQKQVELPPPDPAAATTRRAIVQRLTDRFLRYCNDDDRHLPADERQTRAATRNHILTLMLLRHTDVAALAPAWRCDIAAADLALDELADQFSFVFAQEIERQPHALVKEILREWLRDQPVLPAALQQIAERLCDHFTRHMRERELALWGVEPELVLSAEERAALEGERRQHQRVRNKLDEQIASHSELAAPVAMLNQRDDAQAEIERIEARLAQVGASSADGLRRPLWNDESWRDALLSRVNALCWADRGGERAMRLLVPMWVEALEFHPPTADELLDVAREFAESWPHERRRLVEDGKQLATFDALLAAASSWRLTTLQRAIAHIQRGNLLLKDGVLEKGARRSRALQAAAEAARLLPEDGGEVAVSLGGLYVEVGGKFLWREQNDPAVSPEAERALSTAVHYVPTHRTAWYNLGVAREMLNQHAAALVAYQRAIAHDPKDAYPHHGLGNVYRDLGQHAAALAAFQQAIALDPKFANPHIGLGNVFSLLGRTGEARSAYQRAVEIDPKDYGPMLGLARLERLADNIEQAASRAARARSLLPEGDHYNLACLESIAGNVAAALDALRVALERREVSLAWARQDPDFDFIRDDPRFGSLVGGGEPPGD